MAGTGDWEVVRNAKKSKPVINGKLNKEEKSKFLRSALVVTDTGKLATVNLEKEIKKVGSPKPRDDKKKKPERRKVLQPSTLEEAVQKLNVSEMENLLDVVTARFADNPLIWLKDLASYLNVRVNPTHQPDPIFTGYPASYPVSLMPAMVKKMLVKTVSKCSDSVLAAFHKHCITSMVQEQVKGLSVAGYKLFIQILSIHRPQIALLNLPYYCEMRNNIQNQAKVCLSLLWAIGQAGMDDFSVGLRVWIEFLVPIIGLKSYSTFVVDYGSRVFGGGGGSGTADCTDVLGVREFFSILDFTWCSSGSLPKVVQRQLFSLYPKVKTTAFSSNPELTLHNFFPSFLLRLDPNAPHLLRVELLTCLIQCLTQDRQCWSVWSQLYAKHLPQSAILLAHLCKEKKIVGQLMKSQLKEVRDAMTSFNATNDKLAQKGHAVAGCREARKATETFLSEVKGARGGSRAPSLLKAAIILLLSAMLWDVTRAGSFKGSIIGKTAERFGMMPYLEIAGTAAKTSFIQAYRWCHLNLPVMYARGCELAGPYLLLVWSKAEVVLGYAWAALENGAQYVPVLKEKVESQLPGLSEGVAQYGSRGYEAVREAMVVAHTWLAPHLATLHVFIMTRILVGPLAPEVLYDHVVQAANTTMETLLALHQNLVTVLEEAKDR